MVKRRDVPQITSCVDKRDECKRSADEASKGLKGHQNQGLYPVLGAAWKVPTYWPCGVRRIGGMTLIWAFVRNLRTGSVMQREKAQVADPRGRKYRYTDQGRTAP